jgi:hypothetical protein
MGAAFVLLLGYSSVKLRRSIHLKKGLKLGDPIAETTEPVHEVEMKVPKAPEWISPQNQQHQHYPQQQYSQQQQQYPQQQTFKNIV